MAQKQNTGSGSGTVVLMIIAVALFAFAGGYFIGTRTGGDLVETAEVEDAAQGAAARGGEQINDSQTIPVADSPTKGNPNAPITIVEFSEFQCPYCNKGANTIEQVLEKYPNDVRVVFKHFPLGFHKQAVPASKAALAAGEQGKFWEMHDRLFANQKQLKGKSAEQMKEWTAGLAKQIGIDVQKFKQDFDNPEYDKIIQRDQQLGKKLSVRGTPHFFVNGERVKGAQPPTKFEQIIKSQLEEAKKMRQAGVKRADLYAKMVDENFNGGKAQEAKKKAKPKQQKVAYVPVTDDDPVKGNTNDPLVTIVEFSDFQCPFCGRVNPTLDQLTKKYGDHIRIVFKQNPLPFHKQAPAASKAALAANKQGKFWEMHDLLFENQKKMKTSDMTELTTGLAQQLGLNVSKFKQDMQSDAIAQKVKQDQALARKLGARGTPNFFVNGVQIVGAKPYPAFESVVKEQIAKAKKLKKSDGLKGEALYKAVVELNEKEAPTAAPSKPKPKKPADTIDQDQLQVGNSFAKGPKNAPVTVWEFSDFQCPYCKRGADTIDQVLKEYPGKVRVVFKAFPLPFHKQAEPAHRAAIAAGKQGKFWEMHDKLFSNQGALKSIGSPSDPNIDLLLGYAQEIGLNVQKFKKDFNDPATKKQVQQEMAMGRKVGIRGTPGFFINNKRLVGAQPIAKFKELIDAELQ